MKLYGKKVMALVLALAMMLSCGINVFAAADRTRHNFEIEIEYTGDTGDDRVDLEDAIYDELYDLDFVMEYYEIGTDNDEYDLDNELLYYGRVNSSDVYIADPDDDALDALDEDGELHEEYIYYVAEDDYGDEYYGRITVVLLEDPDSGMCCMESQSLCPHMSLLSRHTSHLSMDRELLDTSEEACQFPNDSLIHQRS